MLQSNLAVLRSNKTNKKLHPAYEGTIAIKVSRVRNSKVSDKGENNIYSLKKNYKK